MIQRQSSLQKKSLWSTIPDSIKTSINHTKVVIFMSFIKSALVSVCLTYFLNLVKRLFSNNAVKSFYKNIKNKLLKLIILNRTIFENENAYDDLVEVPPHFIFNVTFTVFEHMTSYLFATHI